MDEEERENISLREIAAADVDLKKIIEAGQGASYKIEIHFGPDRTTKRDYKALVLLMESGKFFHGGGDGQMYICMDHRPFEARNTTPPSALPLLREMAKERTRLGCGHPITGADIRGRAALCPGCKNLINIEHMTGQIPFFGSTVELAEMVAILFHKLKDDADIYCKYHPKDIRYELQAKTKGTEEARRLRALMIYPLHRIHQDLLGGASLEDRFKACFSA